MSANKFTKSNIQEIIVSETGLEVRKANELTIRIVKAMTAALISGDSIELRGFGTLDVKERKAHTAHNPKTGETLTTPDRRRVVFRPGHELKAALRNAPG